MAVKLHRCPVMWPKTGKHRWSVQMALDEAGIDYEVVKESWLLRSRRKAVIEHTGQRHLSVVELEDGTWYREPSADMAKAIRAGKLGSDPRS